MGLTIEEELAMRAYQKELVVEDDGHLQVEDVPVRAGQRVQVIVLMPEEANAEPRYPLRGQKLFEYREPNEPVGEDDWDQKVEAR